MNFSPDKPASRRWWLAAGLALATVLMSVLLGDLFRYAWWVRAYSAQARQGAARALPPVGEKEAIVVLTGDAGRIARAIELLRTRGSPLLVISGAKKGVKLEDVVNQQGDASTNIHEVWKKIVLESVSSSTVENALESARILAQNGVKRVILVTSEYHMFRAVGIFRTVAPGYDYLEYPIASEVTELSLVPHGRTISALWKLWIEYWKYFTFRHVGPRAGAAS